jgi:hypothetical protein
MRKEISLLSCLALIVSCSGTTPANKGNGAGGALGVGGNNGGNTGGALSSGGSSGTSVSSGGIVGTGGNVSTGGSLGTGGNSTGSGGRQGTGGNSTGSGGILGNGGRQDAGVVLGAGGKQGSGGNIGSGGTAASDGGAVAVSCDRAGLQAAVDAYLAALQSADTTKMPLDASVKYTEVVSMATASKTTPMGSGLWQTALPVKFSRSLLDATGCETFTEIFITSGDHPYVLGTRLAIKGGKITEIYVLVTDSDDWNFDAAAYDTCSESEDWSPVPAANQSTREALIAAGEAYFKIFSDKSTVVPWGNPCYRLEGGKGCTPQMDKSSTSCNVGIPDNITFKNTHWVVDVDLNASVGITLFAGASPDSHMFRLVGGKIRYVHTLTIMN